MELGAVNKAIGGALTAALVALLSKYGVILAPEVNDAMSILIVALVGACVGFVGVYLSPKNKEGS